MNMLSILIVALAGAASSSVPPDSTVVFPIIEVSATRISDAPEEQPFAFYRQDRDTLDEVNAATLTDRLQFAPGVFIQQTAPNQASPFLRGLTGEQTLLLLDGVRYNHAAMRSGPNQYAALIADESIGSVDIVLGSSSTVSGSDGLTGALDFRLDRPGRAATTAFSPWLRSRVSTSQGVVTSAGIDGHKDAWRYSVDASAANFTELEGGSQTRSRLLDAEDDRIPNTAYRQRSISGRVRRIRDLQSVEVSAGFTEQLGASRPDGYAQNSFEASRVSRYFDPQRFAYVHVRHATTPDISWLGRIQTTLWWHDHYEEQIREDIRDQGTASQFYRRREMDDGIGVMGLDFQATSALGRKHTLTYGSTWIAEKTRNEYREYRTAAGELDPAAATAYAEPNWLRQTTVPDGATYNSLAFFVQDSWQMTEFTRIVPGLRWSRFDWQADAYGRGYTVDVIEGDTANLVGSLRAYFEPSERHRFFIGRSQGFRAPNLTNLTGQQDRASSNVFFQGNPDLEAERSLTEELGWRLVGKQSLAITLFNMRIGDFIQRNYRDVDGDAIPDAVQENAEEAALIGGEIALHLEHGRFAIDANTSLVHSEIKTPTAFGRTKIYPLSRANRWVGRLSARADLGRSVWLSPRVRFAGDYDSPAPRDAADVRMTVVGGADGSMPGFVIADLWAGWQSRDEGLSVQLGLENLLDRSYRDVGSGADGPGRGLVLEIGLRR